MEPEVPRDVGGIDPQAWPPQHCDRTWQREWKSIHWEDDKMSIAHLCETSVMQKLKFGKIGII